MVLALGKVTFGLGVNSYDNIPSLVRKSITAEALGLDYVWISDSPDRLYAPVVASVVASRTTKIRIGLGLISALLHTPSQIASSVMALRDAHGNRFELCIGPGDRMQLHRVGIRLESIHSLPLKILRAKQMIKCSLRDAGFSTKIWLGAQGPRMLKVAKNFDGVLLNYSKPAMIAKAITDAKLQPARGFRIGIYSPSYVYFKPQQHILRLAKRSSAVVALGATGEVLRKFGLYKKLQQARRIIEAAATLEPALAEVPEDIVDNFSITMAARNFPSYLAELRRLGVSNVVLSYPQDYSIATVKELAKALELARVP